MPSAEQLAAFDAFDFDSDARWEELRLNLTIPPGRDEAAVIRRYKQKFFKRYVDPDFEVESVATASPQSSAAPPPSTSSSSSGQQQVPPPRPRSAAQPPPAAGGGAAAPRPRLDSETAVFLANAVVLVMAALAVFPLSPPALASRGFRWALLGSGAAAGYAIWQQHRGPRAFTWEAVKEWLGRVLNGPEFLTILSCIVFLPSVRPISMAVVPQGISALLAVAQHLQRHFSRAQLYRAYFERPCVWLTQNRVQLQQISASTEVGLGFLLIFYFLTPQRSLVQAVLFWQLLKLKFHAPATSWNHRQAWAALGQKTEPLIQHYAPFLMSPLGYAKRWFLAIR